MAVAHIDARVLGRSGGFSALNSVAYGLCTELTNTLTGEHTRDYTEKKGFVSSFTLAPEYAPAWMYDPIQLASFIDKMEPRRDSQLLREFIISMPIELSHEQQQALSKELVETLFVARGMIGMVFLHDEGRGNPHIHTMLTMRTLEQDGSFGKKCREWNEHTNIQEWRSLWAEITNNHLKMAGQDVQISHLSYKEQNNGLLPTERLCRAEWELAQRGHHTAKGDRNQKIRAINRERQDLLQKRTAEWEAATQMVRGLAAVAMKKWEMSISLEALEHMFNTWVEQVKETVKAEAARIEAQQREMFRQVAASERGKEEEKTELQPVQDEMLQRRQEAYDRKKRASLKPNGWKMKAKKDWQSVRKLRLEQQASERNPKKPEQEPAKPHKTERVSFEAPREAEKERVLLDEMLQRRQETYRRAKRESLKPNGWKMKAKKDWQAVRARREEQEIATQREIQRQVAASQTAQKKRQEALLAPLQTANKQPSTVLHRLDLGETTFHPRAHHERTRKDTDRSSHYAENVRTIRDKRTRYDEHNQRGREGKWTPERAFEPWQEEVLERSFQVEEEKGQPAYIHTLLFAKGTDPRSLELEYHHERMRRSEVRSQHYAENVRTIRDKRTRYDEHNRGLRDGKYSPERAFEPWQEEVLERSFQVEEEKGQPAYLHALLFSRESTVRASEVQFVPERAVEPPHHDRPGMRKQEQPRPRTQAVWEAFQARLQQPRTLTPEDIATYKQRTAARGYIPEKRQLLESEFGKKERHKLAEEYEWWLKQQQQPLEHHSRTQAEHHQQRLGLPGETSPSPPTHMQPSRDRQQNGPEKESSL